MLVESLRAIARPASAQDVLAGRDRRETESAVAGGLRRLAVAALVRRKGHGKTRKRLSRTGVENRPRHQIALRRRAANYGREIERDQQREKKGVAAHAHSSPV